MKQRPILTLALALALLLSAAGCTSKASQPAGSASSQSQSTPEDSGSQSQPDASAEENALTPEPPAMAGSVDKETSGKAEQPDQGAVETSGEAPALAYDFSQSVPESEAVDNSYFEDAAFIGDSRTDGFLIYSGIGCGDNLTSNGLSIFKLTEKKAFTIDGKQYTLAEALALKQYGKVYLSLGVNELGYYDDQGFYQAYCEAIDLIRSLQPHAVIYIQGLIPLNEDVIAQTGGASYLKNDHLLVYNDLMKQAAEEKQVAFLDLNPEFTGEDGQLPADASKDGVHLRKDYCVQWLDYLKTHTVSYETLYGGQNS